MVLGNRKFMKKDAIVRVVPSTSNNHFDTTRFR